MEKTCIYHCWYDTLCGTGERNCDHENITLWQLIIVEWQQKWNLFCSTGPWRMSLSIWASARRGKPINCHPPRSCQFQPPLSPHRPCGPPQLLCPSPPETPVKVAWVWGNAGAWQPAPEDCTGTHQVCQSQTASIHHSLRYQLLSKTLLALDMHDFASAVVWNFFSSKYICVVFQCLNYYIWVWGTTFGGLVVLEWIDFLSRCVLPSIAVCFYLLDCLLHPISSSNLHSLTYIFVKFEGEGSLQN